MKEKHRKIPILVLAVTTVLLFGFFMLTASQALADQGHKGNGQQNQWQNQKQQNNQPPGHSDYNQKNAQPQGHHDYNQRPDYDKYAGYRAHPYNKGLHYGNYDYRGHRYDYHGHWRSWDQWHRYASQHQDIERHGTYYRENSHLMFRYCEPGTGACFFFSIGG
jgi:hypothetical protein